MNTSPHVIFDYTVQMLMHQAIQAIQMVAGGDVHRQQTRVINKQTVIDYKSVPAKQVRRPSGR